MQIEPKAGPTILNPGTSTAVDSSAAAAATRAAVIAKIEQIRTGNQAQEHPVANPNQVSPEELSAIRAPSKQVQSPTNETSTAEVDASLEATKPKEEPLSSQYANLARKEKALRAQARARQAEYDAQKAAIEAREAAMKAKEAEYQSSYVPKDKLKSDPFSVLSELGLSYDEITQLAMNAPKAEDVQRQRETDELRNEIKAIKQAQEDQQKQSYQQALNNITSEAQSLVRNDPNFETIRETGNVRLVTKLIERVFEKEGTLLTVEEAATEVEEELVNRALKMSRIGKIQQRLRSAQQAAAPKPQPEAPKQQQQPQLKTLTNAVSSSRPMSMRERAIAAMEGRLQK